MPEKMAARIATGMGSAIRDTAFREDIMWISCPKLPLTPYSVISLRA
jgi:hypothetical protein